MAWQNPPRTWTAGEIITADIMNAAIRDTLRYLKGNDGVPTIQSGLIIDNASGDEYFRLPALTTSETTSTLTTEANVAYDETLHKVKYRSSGSNEVVLARDDVDDVAVDGASTVPISSNWAYDFQNTLTAQGDIPYASASGAWTRLPKGTANQFLQMNAGATAPQWTTGILNNKILSHTRVVSASDGDVSYTGYGFQPKGLVVFSNVDAVGEASWGISDVNLAEMCIYERAAVGGGAGAKYMSPNTLIYLADANPNGAFAVLKTFDADGFTLTWTQVGTPSGVTANLVVLALA